MNSNAVLSGLIYRFKRGRVSAYSTDPGRYNCAIPAEDWSPEVSVGDVWICDRHGNVDPGLNVTPVPVARITLGPLVGRSLIFR
jgi:hypothetical protein